MKRATVKLLKVVITLLVLVVVPYVAFYVYINERGKDILVSKLEKKFNTKVELQALNFNFPLRFSLVDLKIKDLKVTQGVADLGFSNPFIPVLVLENLYLDGCTYVIRKEDLASLPFKGNEGESQKSFSHASFIASSSNQVNVKVKEIILRDCAVIFKHSKVSPPLELRIEDIKGVIKDFHYPSLSKFSFNLISSLGINESRMKEVLFASGWIDWPKKGMDVKSKANNIDYFAFDPYYPPFWKTKNLELKETLMSLDAQFTSEDDELLIDYRITLEKVIFNEDAEDPSKVKNMETVLSLFTQKDKPVLRLRHTTKMSKPTFKVTFIGEGLLGQLKIIEGENGKDAFDQFLDTTRDVVEKGVTKLRELTVDPPLKAVRSLFEEFLKNVSKIVGRYPKSEDNNVSETFKE